MENKKKEKLRLNEILSLFLSIGIITYFFYGFYSNENSAGAGPYDFELIWSNLELLSQNTFSRLDSLQYNDSRPPLSYILHIYFNPFYVDQQNFRFSVLLISLLVPVLFFFSIKDKFKVSNKYLLLLLSLIITLSPFYRTNSFWGLGENYGIIFLLSSYLVLSKIKYSISKNEHFKNYLQIFILCLFSSLCVYFDQKLVFVPIIVIFTIFCMNVDVKIKISSVVFFSILAIPFLYLIYLWGSILPPDASKGRFVGQQIHVFHPGYCLTIIAFYLAPLLLLKNLRIDEIKKKIFKRKFLLIILFLFFYILLSFTIGNFETLPVLGKGFLHKILILIENLNLRIFLTTLSFLFAVIIIFGFIDNKNDIIIISFFLMLSLFTYPFQQEYLDPLIYILTFTFFKTNLKISFKNTYFLLIFFLVFSLASKYYYKTILT